MEIELATFTADLNRTVQSPEIDKFGYCIVLTCSSKLVFKGVLSSNPSFCIFFKDTLMDIVVSYVHRLCLYLNTVCMKIVVK